ncbi:hypothetical protein QTP88_019301 [Uroleucon formosanum]
MVEMRTPSNSFDFDFFEARRLAADKSIESLREAKQKAKVGQITSDFSSSESQKKKKKEHTLKRSRIKSKQTKKLPR